MPDGKVSDRLMVHDLDMIIEQRHQVVGVLQLPTTIGCHVDRCDRALGIPGS